jgi:opacity protein-like surface antigen
MRLCVVLVALFVAAAPAAAQSTYVGASLVGDFARFGGVDFEDDEFSRIIAGESSEDGGALGFNVKLGRELGERWGVELEFARTGEYEHRNSIALPAGLPERLDIRIPLPPFEFETERRHTMIAALAFVRQELGDRVGLSYFGGVSFNRVDTEQEFTGPRILIFPPVTIPSYETIDYGVGPAVGVEAAFKFGAAAVTTGVRLQSANGAGRSGWLIRPNVGMRWTF